MTLEEAIELVVRNTSYTKENVVSVEETDKIFNVLMRDSSWESTYHVYKTDGRIFSFNPAKGKFEIKRRQH